MQSASSNPFDSLLEPVVLLGLCDDPHPASATAAASAVAAIILAVIGQALID
jgi:hypothetical protein